jgi:hypothetical protein
MLVKSQKIVNIFGMLFTVNTLNNGKIVVRDSDGHCAGFRHTHGARVAADLPAWDERDDGRQGLWLICDECSGTGKHSQHMGVISTEDWEDEDLDRYFAGHYDKPCACRTGFVWMDAEHCKDCGDSCECQTCQRETAEYAAQDAATRRAESGMGYY